jgi:hypothetical protein
MVETSAFVGKSGLEGYASTAQDNQHGIMELRYIDEILNIQVQLALLHTYLKYMTRKSFAFDDSFQ